MGSVVSVPDHCLSFYFENITRYQETMSVPGSCYF